MWVRIKIKLGKILVFFKKSSENVYYKNQHRSQGPVGIVEIFQPIPNFSENFWSYISENMYVKKYKIKFKILK